MFKSVVALALAAILCATLPAAAPAETPHKYGVELQLGGGYFTMGDVNDFVPSSAFNNIEPDKLNLGSQLGVGILYRHLDNFGWHFGYSRFIMLQKYRVSAYLSAVESWCEQTVSGSELYAMATWFWPTDIGEISLGVGPAFYSGALDRSIDIVQDGQTHLTAGTFADAEGNGFGMLGNIGLEIPLKETLGLGIVFGGRLAAIDKIMYKDAQEAERTVYTGGSNATFGIDYSGAFAKLTLRAYFKPDAGWRSPGQ
ncbi:MAG: hypothetical protein FJY65_08845 [Calditrichaeota bacterium]|nr:hypothetical protein [Calditrichota bacterium]